MTAREDTASIIARRPERQAVIDALRTGHGLGAALAALEARAWEDGRAAVLREQQERAGE